MMTPSEMIQAVRALQKLLAAAPELIADLNACVAAKKDPEAEVKALAELLADLQKGLVDLSSLFDKTEPENKPA